MILKHWRTGICVSTNTGELFKMNDTLIPQPENQDVAKKAPSPEHSTRAAVEVLEGRLAELENVVHQLTSQIVQRGWLHGVTNTVMDWYHKMKGG